jgi:hypothetical protein
MGWRVASWTYWLACFGVPALESWADGKPPSSIPYGQRAETNALDLWLVHLVYEFVAAESKCLRCGAALGRRVRVVRSAATHSPVWTVSVVARCGGWRRHRHVATVGDGSDGLMLGPLHAAGPGRLTLQRQPMEES